MLRRDYGHSAEQAIEAGVEMARYRHLARLWAARILVRMGRPTNRYQFDSSALYELALADEHAHTFSAVEVLSNRTLIRERLDDLEAMPWNADGVVDRNLGYLAERFRLSDVDCAVVAFLALVGRFEWFGRLVSDASRYSSLESLALCIAVATGLTCEQIETSLSWAERLVRCGLIDGCAHVQFDCHELPKLIDEVGLGLWRADFAEGYFEAQYLRSPKPIDGNAGHFQPSQLPDAFMTVLGLVRAMMDGKAPIGQILVHGKPGTGKTRFALGLAEALEADCREVIDVRRGDVLRSSERTRAFLLAQELLRDRPRSLLLFDESDESLTTEKSAWIGSSESTRSWLNSVIEQNTVPGIWIANDIDDAHPSTLRRFAMVVEMPDLPEAVRTDILRNQVGELPIDEGWLAHVARTPSVTPALMHRAAVIGHALAGESDETIRRAMTTTLEGHCRAAGTAFVRPQPRGCPTSRMPYSSDWLNTDPCLAPILDRLSKSGEPMGRLLLHGPPGTGKSRLGRDVAERLQRPLRVVTASDLLDAYVGETEKRIRKAFEIAEQEREVLLLDEIDGLLFDRAQAQRSWEITQVNELLTRIDAFDGVLLASTNRLAAMDPAVLRRFDLKVRFHYMKPQHARELLEALLGGETQVPSLDLQRLDRLGCLTPGDFRTAVRRIQMTGEALAPKELIDALADEVAAKPEAKASRIGFTAALD